MRRSGTALVTAIYLSLCLLLLPARAQGAVEMIRNGSFAAGLAQWNKNPALPSTWNPLYSGAVDLHPPAEFNGDVIYQNLNVTGIAGVTASFSCTLSKLFSPTGHTVAIYADYVTTQGAVVSAKIVNPANDSLGSAPQAVTGSLSFPSTAVRLVKLRVAKEDSGDFQIDDISLTADTVSVGALPTISSLSSTSGAYGGDLSVTGSGFGASTGMVTLSGSPSGVAVKSWSDTSVTVTLSDPARSGTVILKTAGQVESDTNQSFAVSSPNYTCDLMSPYLHTVKGNVAEFVIKTAFLNGFTTGSGISFTVSGLPANAVYAFAPVPLTRPGGAVLKVATANLPAGSYDISIQASAAGMAPRALAGRLAVATASSLSFYQTQSLSVPPYAQSVLLGPELNVSGQGNLSLSVLGLDTDGISFAATSLKSSNPVVVGVYKNSFGWDVYAHDSGSAVLTATAPDGTEKTLAVNVSVPAGSRIDVSLLPQSITNTYTGPVQLYTGFTLGANQWYSVGTQGMIVMTDSTLDFNMSPPPYYYSGQFKVDQDKTALGSYPFTGTITSSFGGPTLYSNAAVLTITNDPSYAGLNLTVKSIDGSVMPQMYEYFDLEFRDPATGALAFTRTNTTFTMGDTFFIGAITPGSYKVCLNPLGGMAAPSCYPNAATVADAVPVDFAAGSANDRALYFFAQAAPDTTPPSVSFDINGATSVGSDSLTVTGINLWAWDMNGVTGYCLAESADPAGCSWSPVPPTQYDFTTPGVKQLYAFAKDPSGNLGSAPPVQVTVTVLYSLTLQFAGAGHGTVMGDLACGTPSCTPAPFASGGTATLIAVPDADSTASWSGCSSVTGTTCSVIMSSPKTVTLTFSPIPPVRNKRTGTTYSTIMAAYAEAGNLDVIQSRATLVPLSEPLNFSRSSAPAVTIQGGMSGSFTPATGCSTVQGTMRISRGKVTVDKLKLKP